MGTSRGNGEAKIERLVSGNFRTHVMIDGRGHTITGDTVKDVRQLRSELLGDSAEGIMPARQRYTQLMRLRVLPVACTLRLT